MTKRLFALLLCLVMCLSLLPTSAFAEAELPEDCALVEEPAEESVEEPADEPPLEGEVAAEQPEGSDAEEPETEEPLSPGEAGTAPLAGEPEEEPTEEPEEDFEDPFLPVEEADDQVSDKAADLRVEDPAGGHAQTVSGTLKLGTTDSGYIGSDTFKYFKFVPDSNAIFVFTSTSDNDTVGYLYDANWNLLDSDDDGGDNSNFSIQRKLTSGTTYYLCVAFYFESDSGSFPIVVSQIKPGWNKVGDLWYYVNDDGSFVTGWKKISGTWYYFDDYSSYMYADGGWRTDDYTKLYYFKASGAWDNTKGWKENSQGERFYVGGSGQLLTRWQTIDGKKYYFDNYRGYAYRGFRTIDGDQYFFNNDGSLGTKGWNKVVHRYTWTDGAGNEHTETYTSWYYLESDGGLPITGWKKISGKWYYFDPEASGRMVADQPREVDGKMYFFTSSGALAGAGWQKIVSTGYDSDGTAISYTYWFYTDSSGVVKTGWQKIDGKWYYFTEPYGEMCSDGIRTIDGKDYYFSSSGAMQTGWIKASHDWTDDAGKKFTEVYWYYANGSGVLQKGWQTIGGKKYYFDSYYDMYAGDYYTIDDVNYFFTSSGALAGAGWQSIKGEYNGTNYTDWYYCNADGSLVLGWKKIGGTWYYFNYYMYAGGLYEIDGKYEFFKSNGAWVATGSNTAWRRDGSDMKYYKDGKMAKGWEKIEGEWYFFDRSTGKMKTGWLTDNGKRYYLMPMMRSNTVMAYGGDLYMLGSDGAVVTKTGWYKRTITEDGATWIRWYYITDSTGKLAKGLKTINGKLYYFGPSMATDYTITIDSVKYYFDKDGVGHVV